MDKITQLDNNISLFMDPHNPEVIKELARLGKIETMNF